jgi:hypothetical protein
MKIDIDKLSEPELIDLNYRIVARLRFLSQSCWGYSPAMRHPAMST